MFVEVIKITLFFMISAIAIFIVGTLTAILEAIDKVKRKIKGGVDRHASQEN